MVDAIEFLVEHGLMSVIDIPIFYISAYIRERYTPGKFVTAR